MKRVPPSFCTCRCARFQICRRSGLSGACGYHTQFGAALFVQRSGFYLARELSADPKVLSAAQSTRGGGIGAADYLHQRTAGTVALVIGENLDEVLALSDRIAVMFAGRIEAILPRD
jgi:hypothetical protein